MVTSQRRLKISDIEKPPPDDEHSFQAKLRMAIFDGIKEDDVSEVVKQIVRRAKDGDPQALSLFFRYILGSGQ